MPSMSSLIHKLRLAHPTLTFTESEQFSWSPSDATVFYDAQADNAPALLLHELSHALLEHREYRRDVELIAMETAAWKEAASQASLYKVAVDEDIVQDHLDTYRDWLHARSTCPHCSATGYQTGASEYQCPACTHTWRVNEARLCALRRYSLTDTTN